MNSTGVEHTGAFRLTGDVAKVMAEVPAIIESLSGIELRRLVEAIPALKAAVKEESP